MGQGDAAEAAVRQAAAEGLTLQPADSAAGYRCVYKACSKARAKPFQVKVWRAGKKVRLGSFATAEEAALAYARTPEAQAEVANPKPSKSAPLPAPPATARRTAPPPRRRRSCPGSPPCHRV